MLFLNNYDLLKGFGSAEPRGYQVNYGNVDITIDPQNLKDFGDNKNVFPDETPSYTYFSVYSIKPEMARNLANLGRPFRKPVGVPSQSSSKNNPNKFWKNFIIPSWFSQ